MRRRPLCFLCIVLVILNYVLVTSGDFSKSPDVFLFLKDLDEQTVRIYGEVYQCEYKEEKQILYVKETVLMEPNDKSGRMDGEEDYYKLKQIKITCPSNVQEYKIGDFVTACGILREITSATNPGQFDSQSYYAGKQIFYTMWEPKTELIKRPAVHLQRSLYELRCRCSEVILEGVLLLAKNGEESCQKNTVYTEELEELANVMQGIVLGDKGGIADDTASLYQMGGISHILAISAMHLTILGNGLYGILKRLGLSIRISGVLACVFLMLYGILTGASAATLRALIMFLLNVGAQLTGRTYDGKTSLSIAAVLLLSGNPLSLTDSGFLLSFTAMVSFAIFREKRKIWSSVLLYLFMMPVTLWLFYEIPVYSILINLLVVPTLSIVLISGVLACLLGGLNLVLGAAAAIPGIFFLFIYEQLCETVQYLPYAKLVLGRPDFAGILLYYTGMMCTLWLFRKYRLSYKRVLVYLLMIPGIISLIYHPHRTLEITALDVGQGDCIVLQIPGNRTYMVDGGSSSVQKIGTYRILPYLKYKGIRTLEGVFITHPDEDHISGIVELLELIRDRKTTLKIRSLVLPNWQTMEPFETVIQLADDIGIPIQIMEKGACYNDGEVFIQCLSPDEKDYSGNMNEGSLVLEVSYKEFTALLTGDLEGMSEQDILEEVSDIDYLKVAHHGSSNSTYEAFLERTNPEISVISCGKKNRYGHPHKELLIRLKCSSSDVYATKDYGAIWVTTDGEKIDLSAFCKYN